MTRALDSLNSNEGDIGEERTKAKEPGYVKPTNPVIPEPAKANPSMLAAAIESARISNERKRHALEEARTQLDEKLMSSEPPRDQLQADADALEHAATKGPEAKAAAAILAKALADRQELLRNLRQVANITTADLPNLGENVEEQLAALIGANTAMREVIRHICANAGTVRVDEVVPIQSSSNRVILQRRFVDVGDEEPGQDPIVDLKWLLPAGLRVAARFNVLMQEHKEATKRAIEAKLAAEAYQARLQASEAERTRLQTENAALKAQVKDQRPNAPGTPAGYFLMSEDGKWVGRYEGKHACFLTRWRTVATPQEAYAFDYEEQAQELLGRLQFARIHRIAKATRETLRVVTIHYADHSA